MRTVFTWRVLGDDLIGTHHTASVPQRRGAAVALLLLNPGPAVRSGNSDLSARIADRQAAAGFDVFRVDFAGLGDSSGAPALDLDGYRREVVGGRNDAATLALVDRLSGAEGFATVVVGGLCAAAVPALRSLASVERGIGGLVLLEPSFENDDDAPPPASLRRRIESGGARFGAAGTAAAAFATRVLGACRDFARVRWERLLGPRLPRGTDVELVHHWRAASRRGLPSLVVVSADEGADRRVTRILASDPLHAVAPVTCVRLAGTNHLFTSGNGITGVLAAVEAWMHTHFPAVHEAKRSPVGVH